MKILIVDDEHEICRLIHKALERSGKYEVLSTSLPEEVFDLCIREQPDLLLLDIVMPNMDGRDLIRGLKEDRRTANIRIIVTSGLGEMAYDEKKEKWEWQPNRPVVKERGEVIQERSAERAAQAYGVDDFIGKPFSPDRLIAVVEENVEKLLKLRGNEPDGG